MWNRSNIDYTSSYLLMNDDTEERRTYPLQCKTVADVNRNNKVKVVDIIEWIIFEIEKTLILHHVIDISSCIQSYGWFHVLHSSMLSADLLSPM
jgi:hypothetical protein